jgi:hypothetical protein
VADIGDGQSDDPEDHCPIGHLDTGLGGQWMWKPRGGEARVLGVPGPNDSEPLIREHEPHPTAWEQSWLTEEVLASPEEERRLRMAAKEQKKKVAEGTSHVSGGKVSIDHF